MADERRVLVRNPNSGDRKQSSRAKELALAREYEVRESQARGETRTLAREAATEDDVSLVVACGGDGTLNEVVRGVDDAGALPAVELGVVPAGTGNNFADNVGIRGVEHAFRVIEMTDPGRSTSGGSTSTATAARSSTPVSGDSPPSRARGPRPLASSDSACSRTC